MHFSTAPTTTNELDIKCKPEACIRGHRPPDVADGCPSTLNGSVRPWIRSNLTNLGNEFQLALVK